MSLYGNWQCPICRKKWRGGIDYNGYSRIGVKDDWDEIIEVICGCTNKKFSDEQLKKVISFSKFVEHKKVKK